MNLPRYLFALLVCVAAAAPHAVWSSDSHDHDRARRAVEAGEVLPLKTVLERVERDYPGQVMEVELERERGQWFYEIKILRTGGSLLKLRVDARTGMPLAGRERGHKGEKY